MRRVMAVVALSCSVGCAPCGGDPQEAVPVEVGDALVLTVTQEAQGIPAMLLPPLALPELPGLAAYPDPPEVEDRSNRGALTGRRTDRLTWIVEQAGSYDIPGVRYRSWDPARWARRHH